MGFLERMSAVVQAKMNKIMNSHICERKLACGLIIIITWFL